MKQRLSRWHGTDCRQRNGRGGCPLDYLLRESWSPDLRDRPRAACQLGSWRGATIRTCRTCARLLGTFRRSPPYNAKSTALGRGA